VPAFIEKTPCYSGRAAQLPISYRDVDWMAELVCEPAGAETLPLPPVDTEHVESTRGAA
jgi:hypothetical protein